MIRLRRTIGAVAALALALVGTPRSWADSLEDATVSAGSNFDNTAAQAGSVGGAVPGAAGGQASPGALTIYQNAPAPGSSSSAAPPSPVMAKAGEMGKIIKENWKPLLAGAAAGAVIGVGLGGAIPIAGPIVGGILGAVIGGGLATSFFGGSHSQTLGFTMTSAGVGAAVGMALGSAFPIVGTILGGIAGALIGGGLGYLGSK